MGVWLGEREGWGVGGGFSIVLFGGWMKGLGVGGILGKRGFFEEVVRKERQAKINKQEKS